MKRILFLTFGLMFALFIQAKDIQTVVLTTMPMMHCESCENTIKSNLRFEKGVKKIETNLEEQTVTVTYDADKITPEEIVKGFEKFGYKARILKEGEKVVK